MSEQTLNVCPCCGKTLAIVGMQYQHPDSTRPARQLVECTTFTCELFGTTCTFNDLTTAFNAIQKQRAKGQR